MAQSTPRADALRQMREAKFEAQQKRLKAEAAKPADQPTPAATNKIAKAAKSKKVVAKTPL